MSRKTLFIAGLLAGTRMTAAERSAGRFLRAPDGHEAVPAAAPTPAPAEAAPAAAPTPARAPSSDAMAALELEMGDVVLPGSDKDDGNAAPKADEPGVSGSENNDDPAAALEAERQRANAAEEELRQLKAADKGKETPKGDSPAHSQPEDPAPDPKDYEFGEADSTYIADTARWSARQEFAQMRAKEQLTAELNTIEDGWKTATASEDIKTEYPDFDEVVTKGAAEEKWDCTPLMALGIKSSPVGPDVAYELAKNPAEASRIAKLLPVEQAWELGRIEGKHAARRAAKTAEPAKPAKVASSAPPPPASTSRGAGGQYVSEQTAIHERMLNEFR